MKDKDKERIVYFHSLTFPSNLEEEKTRFDNMDLQGSIPFKTKNFKYQAFVLYYEPKTNDNEEQQTKYILKKKRLFLGKRKVKDTSDMNNEANPLIVKAMRTKVKQLIVTGPNFDKQRFDQVGGFMNKKFWQANLLWGQSDNLKDNFYDTIMHVKEKCNRVNIRSIKPKKEEQEQEQEQI